MNRRVLGLGTVVIGAGLIGLGLRAHDAFGSQMSELFRGRPSNEVLAFWAGGAALVVVGLAAALRGKAKV
jgi:hypothetical protein